MTVIDIRPEGLDGALRQRLENLSRANEARTFKKVRKQRIAEHVHPYWMVGQMLRDPQGHEGSFYAEELLMALPAVAETRAKGLLMAARVGKDRRLRDMTPREKVDLAIEVEALGMRRGCGRAAA